jgi:hypothetical protein
MSSFFPSQSVSGPIISFRLQYPPLSNGEGAHGVYTHPLPPSLSPPPPPHRSLTLTCTHLTAPSHHISIHSNSQSNYKIIFQLSLYNHIFRIFLTRLGIVVYDLPTQHLSHCPPSCRKYAGSNLLCVLWYLPLVQSWFELVRSYLVLCLFALFFCSRRHHHLFLRTGTEKLSNDILYLSFLRAVLLCGLRESSCNTSWCFLSSLAQYHNNRRVSICCWYGEK